ncbi:nuclear transport factor 2 family protein [Acidaminobacter sp. JC074]|uniref:nuclear transport factor 2 family protein n=1 Tax=Acidaminobacter sp. JC074 TaxID=2530199 RepID=UPI001F10B623|nr:nuclear transport factor 2 family protein [Acidaminobacter sp. JC074]MCH4886058.1 nuclear transport factor 2 family protein [Acidaminobacter sp. JC074]
MRTINETIEMYVEGTRTGDVNLLRKVFHEKAVMSGELFGMKMIVDSPEHFFKDIAGEKAASNYEYGYEILKEVKDIAVVELNERNLKSANFSNLFQLQKIEDDWYITSKLFTSLEVL